MKYLICIIQPGKLSAVRAALDELGITGMTVSEVQGYGRQHGKTEIYRGAEYEVHFLPKIKVEIAIDGAQEASVIEAIKSAALTGRIGDGKIFSLALDEAVRIRTGEDGVAAL